MLSKISVISFLCDRLLFIFLVIKTSLSSHRSKALKIIALESQVALFHGQVVSGKRPKPRPTPTFRRLWVFLSRFLEDWPAALVIVKPETVIRWQRMAFKSFWRRKSRGRPRTSRATIALIRKIHSENPLWSAERIHDQLVELGISDVPSPNSIVKYLPNIKPPRNGKAAQSWKTFLSNHRSSIWAMDMFTMPTLLFKVLYVFVIVNHDRRTIKHIGVTANPTSFWIAQQLRNAFPFGVHPRYMVHDNDSVFISEKVKGFLVSSGIKPVRTSYRSPWQNGICERTIGILRRKLLDHIIPLDEEHLYKILTEYVEKYYNPVRTHQGVGRKTPIPSEFPNPPPKYFSEFDSEPILGGLYHKYKKAA